VHWNFFITLGLLPVSVTMIRLASKNKLPFTLFAGIISVGYQWCLDHVKIRGYDSISNFIVLGSRDDLFGQNREGIFSFFGIPRILSWEYWVLMIGYLSIFLVGVDVGRLILPTNPPAMRYIKSPQIALFVSFLICSILSISVFQISTKLVGLEVARRFANLPYILWVIAYNTTFLLGYLIVQLLFFNYNTPNADAVPYTLEAINRNGLSLFLLANVLTGLVNMTINTLEASNIKAMAMLSLYALVINAVVAGMRYKGWTVKL
jgi:glucosaminylphosphatidylinositol acyltransferase